MMHEQREKGVSSASKAEQSPQKMTSRAMSGDQVNGIDFKMRYPRLLLEQVFRKCMKSPGDPENKPSLERDW